MFEPDGIRAVSEHISYARPCVINGTSWHPLWAHLGLSPSTGDKVIEIGTARTTDDPGITKVYSCCINCSGAGQHSCLWHNIEQKKYSLELAFDPPSKTWAWRVNGVTVRTETNASFTAAVAVMAGGETDYWENDIGVISHNISTMKLNTTTWSKFSPVETDLKLENYGGRYLTGWWADKVYAYSDHHLTHEEDACGGTP